MASLLGRQACQQTGHQCAGSQRREHNTSTTQMEMFAVCMRKIKSTLITVICLITVILTSHQDNWISFHQLFILITAFRVHSRDQFSLLSFVLPYKHTDSFPVLLITQVLDFTQFCILCAVGYPLGFCSLIVRQAFVEYDKETCAERGVWSVLMGLVWVYRGFRFRRTRRSRFHRHSSWACRGGCHFHPG